MIHNQLNSYRYHHNARLMRLRHPVTRPSHQHGHANCNVYMSNGNIITNHNPAIPAVSAPNARLPPQANPVCQRTPDSATMSPTVASERAYLNLGNTQGEVFKQARRP
jgi:hypothetical protein